MQLDAGKALKVEHVSSAAKEKGLPDLSPRLHVVNAGGRLNVTFLKSSLVFIDIFCFCHAYSIFISLKAAANSDHMIGRRAAVSN